MEAEYRIKVTIWALKCSIYNTALFKHIIIQIPMLNQYNTYMHLPQVEWTSYSEIRES